MLKIYHELKHFANPFLEGQRKTRKKLFAFALLVKRTCCLIHLARTLPFNALAQSKVNHFFPFLDDGKAIDPDTPFPKAGSWSVNFLLVKRTSCF